MDVLWQKGHTNDSVYHVGRVGVNTDHPDEAVTVHGNLKLTGHIIQPSDKRAKEDITEVRQIFFFWGRDLVMMGKVMWECLLINKSTITNLSK